MGSAPDRAARLDRGGARIGAEALGALAVVVVLLLAGGCERSRDAKPSPGGPTADAVPRGGSSRAGTATRPSDAGEPQLLAGVGTHGVIAGVLSFADPGILAFSPDARKDQELYDRLIRRAVPADHLGLLLDAEATVAAILGALRAKATQAPAHSTLLFYYAGHGSREGDGAPYFVGYDTRGESTGLTTTAIYDAIASSFRGQRVVLMADSCYSGVLRRVASRLRETRGLDTLVLASAEASNRSTANWTFTQAVLDSLDGDPIADHDGDGRVTLGEMSDEVGAAMKFREHQRHGYFAAGIDRASVVASSQRRIERARFGSFVVGDYARSIGAEGTRTVRIRQVGPADAFVRFYRYSRSEDRPVPVSSLQPIEFRRYAAGTELKVLWGGKLWDARVVRVEGDFHFITYPGWASSWDEWVLSDRMVDRASGGPAGGSELAAAGPGAEPVEVEWHGRWYPARVLRTLGDQSLIHYEGYDASWDEWVGPTRVRPRAPAHRP